jgi:glycosyltransferase involved in cell wall biosynthesis
VIVGRQVAATSDLDLAIDAFNELGLPLKDGRGRVRRLRVQRPRAGANIEFLGRVPMTSGMRLLGGAKGFIFPPEEDFGIAPLEAMAAGTPVIAFDKGGVPEYIVEAETGVLFDEQTPAAVAVAVRRFEGMKFDDKVLRARAKEFDVEVFRQRIRAFVESEWAKFSARN